MGITTTLKELFIAGENVPISDFGIDYVKSIADIAQPNQRQSAYSKSIEIHGTKEVNILFGHYFDVNVDLATSFNANKKVDAVYYEDSIPQFTGFFRLTEVNVGINNVITYKGTLHGELSNIFKDMGDLLISDLEWSDLDHTYDKATIVANWSSVVAGTGYCYPMIDYLGKTTLAASDLWQVTDFRPAVFIKEIWDRIFDSHGFTYDSTLIADEFLNLIMPAKSNVLSLTAQQILDQSFYVGKTAITQYSQDSLGKSRAILFDDDTGTFYNTLTNQWVYGASFGGYYKTGISGLIKVNIDMDATITLLSSAFVYNDVTFKVRLKSTRRPGGAYDGIGTTLAEWSYSTTFSTTPIVGSQTPIVSIIQEVSVYRRAGEYMYVVIEDVVGRRSLSPGDGTPVTGSMWGSYVQANSELTGAFSSRPLVSGDPMVMANTIPNMKQRDFVMGVIKMFNAYVEDTGEKNLLVEKYDDYYIDDTVDWTNKKNGGISIVPNGTLDAKDYTFSFTKDTDLFHEKYLTDIGDNYGDYFLPIDDDFQTSSKKIALPFGSTLNTTPGDFPSNRVIATMFSVDKTGAAEQADTKPRVLWYGGLIDCKGWQLVSGTVLTTYPYAGDTALPYGDQTFAYNIPTVLTWSYPDGYYFDGDYPVANTDTMPYGGTTLFSSYENMIIDSQSPVIKADFYLSPMDIYNLSFRNRFFIDTAYYRLIKLSKSGDLYSGEFLKIG